MDLTNLEKALNNSDFKEQVYRSLEGVYQISNILNQLDLLKNFGDHDLEMVEKIQAVKKALAGHETSVQELKNKIDALVDNLETTKQKLEARLNMELQGVVRAETQKIYDARDTLKIQLIGILKESKDNLTQALKLQLQGVTKFLGIYVYGRQEKFTNESDQFVELFEFSSVNLQADKSYVVEFSMPYELSTNGIYTDMGEMVLCVKTNSKVWPIINSFYQNKTINLRDNKIVDAYRTTSAFRTPSEQADYKIAVFARKHKELWVNVNYTVNIGGFETSFLNNANFKDLTTQSLPTTYNNDKVFYKHSQAIVYEIIQ